MASIPAAWIPGATYRVQLNQGFTFADAAALVPYLAALGIDTLYASPILLSAPGSLHGYDVNDYRRIDSDLGGRAGFEQLAAALDEAGLRLLLDFVPNHMGIDGPFNLWWRDVLESGRDSPHARFFDIFWDTRSDDRIYLPMLEDHYGRVLEAGKLRLQYHAGELAVAYGHTTFPLALGTYALVLEPLTAAPGLADDTRASLHDWFAACAKLEGRRRPSRRRETLARARKRLALKQRLAGIVDASPPLAAAIEARLTTLNGRAGDPASVDALDAVIEMQHYRLARWQSGGHETGYRRFFTIDSLVGLRMEQREVFHDSHALVGQLIGEGHVAGLRIDHIDGLWDPAAYLERLQQLAGRMGAPLPFFVVVEKILGPDERLPDDWRANGTTGYEFIAAVNGLFVDPEAEGHFTRLYREFTGRTDEAGVEALQAKRELLDGALANTAAILAGRLADLIQADRCWRDLSRHELRVALSEIVSALHVYRTYRREGAPASGPDRAAIEDAAAEALRRNRLLPPEPFEFVRDVLVGVYPPEGSDAGYRDALTTWVMTVQQHTGAVMAKAVEDTAFFRHSRFIALNEVGGDPARFGRSVNAFHQQNLARLASAPHGLVATSTHDTKLSEDVRARLCVLSEVGDEWESWVREWITIARPRHTVVDGQLAPDGNEEYRLYQLLMGAWPANGRIDERFVERIIAAVVKAANEAGVHSAWSNPQDDWLTALASFTTSLLHDDAPGGFVASFGPRARRIAELGMTNTLAQLVLKVTSPGVPDCYQGQEIVELTLVDPDNRRAVDYDMRRALLGDADARTWPALIDSWETGAIKLRVLRDLLRFRAAHPRLFRDGDYRPLPVRGAHAGRIVAFSRSAGAERLVVVVPRLTAGFGWPPLGAVWEDTAVELEDRQAARDVLTGLAVEARPLPVSEAFSVLPVAVLQG